MVQKISGSNGGGRMSAKDVLNDKIKRKNNKCKALEIIRDNIDFDKLTEKEDSLLWSFFVENK